MANDAKMTRQHFEKIARTLAGLKPQARMPGSDEGAALVHDGRMAQWRAACAAFATMCEGENPRFDRDRFLAACGEN